MAHSAHSALFWLQRCINDSSSGDENDSPNVCPDPQRSGTAKGIDAACATETEDFRGSTELSRRRTHLRTELMMPPLLRPSHHTRSMVTSDRACHPL
ncbi:hypothetical protein GN244_ATG13726 [Phytophthora infestans]|uniref:Uncharacterized protein n=1 Tax=Phytophthora infestans TaxID=4787 RepID=A0A833W915_PHYIN|nr:hypothetical protein GN244_ATG13726 [Phytophthora infestans]KAF4147332.1 hypothetical protein GN958_ATG03454 [Phytophthora infestans]